MNQEITKVGVIGGGQLAWMMGHDAQNLGINLFIQTPQKNDPAVMISHLTIFAPVDDAIATSSLAKLCDVITFENEFINLQSLSLLENRGVCFRPSLQVLTPLLDKYEQRCYLQKLNLSVPHFITLDNPSDLLPKLNYPVVVKARRHGYDGQGTFIVDNEETLISKWKKIGYVPILIEDYIPFKQELAIMVVRSITGEIITYPVVETQQKNQVCHRVLVRDDIEERIIKEIEAIAIKFVSSLNAVGIFGIEFFLTENNQILINEIAPRTHNSGHYTIDACHTSQFAQHLRAICGLPLGDITMKKPGSVMVNLLGYENSQNDYLSKREKLQKLPNTYIHWYGKKESRIGRKLGHVTVLSDNGSRETLEKIAIQIEEIWYLSE